MKTILLLIALISTTASATNTDRFISADYKNHLINTFCTAEKSVRLPRTTIDCLGKTYATKYAFAHEWQQGLTDALYYATQINRIPILVLICKDECIEPRAKIKAIATHYNTPIKVIKVVEEIQP